MEEEQLTTLSAIYALRKLGKHGIATTVDVVVKTKYITDKQLIAYGAGDSLAKIKKIAAEHKITVIHNIR